MADINQVITAGLGTPAGVPELVTFGLQVGEEVVTVMWTEMDTTQVAGWVEIDSTQ